jgi:serine/threonine protein kinase
VLCDVADALKYLHTACPPVIHRDVKTSGMSIIVVEFLLILVFPLHSASANILLTDKCEGKLADFGLSVLRKEVPNPQASFCVSAAAGTKSYMPPEYFKGKVSPRLDIYSFGVVIYEVLTGLPSYSLCQRQDLVSYMRDLIRNNVDLCTMLDPRAEWPSDVANSLMKLAGDCTDYDSHERPPMAKVFLELVALLDSYKAVHDL